MTLKGVIVAILDMGVMKHGSSTVEYPNQEFTSWGF